MKIMIFDQGHPVTEQLLTKAIEVFGTPESGTCEIVLARCIGKAHETAADQLQKTVAEERPDVLLMGATALGEEIAPAMGIRLGTGVAAHCVDMELRYDGEVVFLIPAFGGRVIGEIMIPDVQPGRPAIATVKPDIFSADAALVSEINKNNRLRVIDLEPAGEHRGFQLTGRQPRPRAAVDIGKAELILCGGAGLGSPETWQRLENLAKALGGAAGCTRPVVDAGWGPDESSMIGTSGRSVRPKVYIGFGISGAAHHLCGIKDADVIISINKDKKADIFNASDHKGVFNAEDVLSALEEEIGL